jgi:hypothetical protein
MMSTRTRRRHPLIRGYLRELNLALAKLPPEKAAELRQQISAHLQDALPRQAQADEVAAVLSRLGPPAELAADAATGAAPQPRQTVVMRRLGTRLRWARWQSWVLSVVIVLVLAAGVGRVVQVATAPLLQPTGGYSWVYAKDYDREVDTQADDADQTTVPIRSGQLQGLMLNVTNTSDFTETVLGLAPNSIPFGQATVGVSEPNYWIDRGGMVRNGKYTLPLGVPPGQIRMVEVLWRSSVCLARGAQLGIQQIQLRVRVGWLVETDTIPLFQGWYLSGPSHGPCRSRP